MIIRRSTLPTFSIALLLIFSLASCRRDVVDPYYSKSGLVALGDYRADSVQYSKPYRMFTHEGEVNDQTLISTYVSTHTNLLALPFLPDTASPLQIFASQSHTVYHNGKAFNASVTDGTFNMRQSDTSLSSSSNPGRNIDLLFAIQQSFDSLRHQVLETNQSYSRLERSAFDTYKSFRSDHYLGRFENGELSLPFSFFATTRWADNSLFAVKANPQANIPVGDTVLVREGQVTFKKR